MTKTNVSTGTRVHYGLVLGLLLTTIPALSDTAARADILVMRDGSSIETKGAWEVRGPVVVFTLTNGALSSVRASKVDLDASARATVQAAEPPELIVEPVERVEPVLVLTDRDVGHISPEELQALRAASEAEANAAAMEMDRDPAAEEPATDTEAPNAPSDVEDSDVAPSDSDDRVDSGTSGSPTAELPPVDQTVERLQVTQWQQASSDSDLGGTRIVGTLANSSREIASQIQVSVLLLDETGNLVASSEAVVTSGALRPQQSTTFRADIPGVSNFETVQFETQHVALAWRAAE